MKALRSVNISCFFSFSLADCVYIESQRPNTPYFICSIQDFKLVSRFLFIFPLPIGLFHALISSHQPIHTCHTRENILLLRRNSKGNRGKSDEIYITDHTEMLMDYIISLGFFSVLANKNPSANLKHH